MIKKFILGFLFFLPIFFLHAQNTDYLQNFVDTHYQYREKVPVTFTPNTASLRDDCDNKPDSIIYRLWVDEAWEMDARFIFEYDEERRTVFQTYEYTPSPTVGLIPLNKSETSYIGDESVEILSIFNMATEQYEFAARFTRSFEDELVQSSVQESYTDGEWLLTNRSTYSYNELGVTTEIYNENWDSVSESYIPSIRDLSYYTIIEETAYLDSLVALEYNATTDDWEYIGIRVDFVRDAQNRYSVVTTGNYFVNPGEVYIFSRDEYVYDEEGESFDIFNYRDQTNEQPEELPLTRKIRKEYENGLNVVDSTYNYDSELMSFFLNNVSTFEYDILVRPVLQTTQMTPDASPESLTNSRQIQSYYQNCISDTNEEYQESANCKFANPISNGQRGICNLDTGENANLSLYDVLGRKVFQQSITNGQDFSFGQLSANGTYFMTIENETGLMLRRKVIIAN